MLSRIKITQRCISQEEVCRLYNGIHAYVEIIVSDITFSNENAMSDFVDFLIVKKIRILDMTNVPFPFDSLAFLISNLKFTSHLILRSMGITDVLCSQFRLPKCITALSLVNNLLTSNSLVFLAYDHLRFLNLSQNDMSLNTTDWLRFSNLKMLILRQTNIRDLTLLARLNLEELDLGSNNLTDENVSIFGSSNIKSLDLRKNNLTNSSLSFCMRNIEDIHLEGNYQIDDNGIHMARDGFSKSLKNTRIFVRDTSVSEKCVEWIETVNHSHKTRKIQKLLCFTKRDHSEWKKVPYELLLEAASFI